MPHDLSRSQRKIGFVRRSRRAGSGPSRHGSHGHVHNPLECEGFVALRSMKTRRAEGWSQNKQASACAHTRHTPHGTDTQPLRSAHTPLHCGPLACGPQGLTRLPDSTVITLSPTSQYPAGDRIAYDPPPTKGSPERCTCSTSREPRHGEPICLPASRSVTCQLSVSVRAGVMAGVRRRRSPCRRERDGPPCAVVLDFTF